MSDLKKKKKERAKEYEKTLNIPDEFSLDEVLKVSAQPEKEKEKK